LRLKISYPIRINKIFQATNFKLPFLTDEFKSIKNVKIINNKLTKFKGIKIGGLKYFVDSNWIKDFKPQDYKSKLKKSIKTVDKVKKILKKIGSVDILVHHQPPYGILDKVGNPAPKHWRGKHAGSKLILNYIKRKQPKYSFCGHIHEGKGKKKIRKTKVYNLGVADHVIVEI
jgi:Icc-related predicted phosphoesterase